MLQPGRLPRPLKPHRRAPPSRRLRGLPEDLHVTVRPRSRTLLHQLRPQLGCPAQEDWCGFRLLADYDQHLFIEKGMRVGISVVSKRYARVNNARVEGYDP